jgi:hypothetical protein
MSRIEQQIAALAILSPAQLRETWARIDAAPAPSLPAPLLRRMIAQRLQEKRFGSIPALVTREIERIGKGEQSTAASPQRLSLTPGTRLVREWNGRTIVVEVMEDRFRFADQTWRSLSEIARVVTGAHWSGPRFFGLRRHG